MLEPLHEFQRQNQLPQPKINSVKVINGYKIPTSSSHLPTILQQSHYSIEQLLQQRNVLHNQLMEIRKIITELSILQDQTKQKLEEKQEVDTYLLHKKCMENKQLLKELKKQYQDYQFMLTGEYPIKLRQQQTSMKQKINSTKKQINKLNFQLRKPLNIQIVQKYELEILLLEREIEENAYHNQSKKNKLNKIMQQIGSKSKATQSLQKKIIQLEDEGHQSIPDQEIQKTYQTTLQRKQKLQKFYESMQKRKIIEFNIKAKQIDNLFAAGRQIEKTIQSIVFDIHESKQQLFTLKKTQKHKRMKTMILDQEQTRQSRRKRIYTELESHNYFSAYNIEIPEIKIPNSSKNSIIRQSSAQSTIVKPRIRVRSKNNNGLKQTSFFPALQNHNKEFLSNSRVLQPKKQDIHLGNFQKQKKSYEELLKMLKKPKLELQEQYDINDLFYQ